ncbi:MAG: hypothetical protein OXF67_05710 [Cyanobacteria bacterium MAG CAR4_bin_6]|nr:hypothetical protein [Cyanobacteria bacterium MAG CAR4_bin_6]
MTWLRSEGIHPLPALDGGLGKSAGEKGDPEETLLPGKVSATIQKVRRSEGQKVRRSELVSGFRVFLAAGLPVLV